MQTHTLEYRDGDTVLEAFYAFEGDEHTKKPAVLIVHDWSGRNAFVCDKAKQMAEWGYVGIAVDMYGKGKIGNTTEEKQALMQPLSQNRPLVLQRMQAAFKAAHTLPNVDTQRIAGMGFCFGGLCILDLARSGAPLRGVIALHAALSAPATPTTTPLSTKVLVLHGHDDPMVPPAAVTAFENEMTAAQADWQLHIFSQTKHAFTNPEANDDKMGIVYNKRTDQRSWVMVKQFLGEVL